MILPHIVEYGKKYTLSPIFQDYDLAISHSRVAMLIISHLTRNFLRFCSFWS